MFDKKYLGRVAALIFGVIAAVAVLLYAGSHFVDRFSAGLELIDAKLTTVTDVIKTDAYIMRSESPIRSSSRGGSVVPDVHDGTHVQSGALIAEVYSEASPEIETRLDEIDEQIAFFEKYKSEDRSVHSTLGVEKTIYDTLSSMRTSAESGKYADELSMRTSLLVEIKKRAILSGEITDYEAQIERLRSEKNKLREELGNCLETVYAGHAGYYYSGYDGYSDIFSPKKTETMTFDDFGDMISSDPADTSNVVGITVSDYNWYISCMLKKTDAGVLESMRRCDVLFTYSGVSITMTVERVIPETGGDNAIVILRSGRMPTGFDYTRMQPVEISARSYTGFKIPKSAVRVLDGHEGVYIMDEVTIAFRRINIIYDDGTNVMCTGEDSADLLIVNGDAEVPEDNTAQTEYGWIRQNDVVVVSGTELYSGKVIG